MTDQKTKDEKRERMLCFIRDVLIERGESLRSAFECNSFVYCGSKEGQDHLKRVVAVEAAADVFTHIVGEWQRTERRPDWLRAVANQSMATFVEAFRV